MKKKLSILRETVSQMNTDELRSALIMMMGAYSGELSLAEERSRADTEMTVQFQKMKDDLAEATLENETLKKENFRLTEQLRLRNGDLFGRSTEKTEDIIDSVCSGTEDTDPVSEDIPAEDPSSDPDKEEKSAAKGSTGGKKERKPSGKKKKGKRAEDLSRLPGRTEFQFDVNVLNDEYGEGNWRIAYWEPHRMLENIPCTKYVRTVYTPVISTGLEHSLVRIPVSGQLLPGSIATPSLAAEIMYNKFVLGLPLYRQEADFIRSDVPVSRQTMVNWVTRFALDLFGPVYDYLAFLLKLCRYNQCDETVLQVVCDGRKAGSLSYMWVHTLSELFSGNPIVLFCFELTRGTEHLREFYLRSGYKGFLTSDAYVSYEVLERESQETESSGPIIRGTGCLMHARRRFTYAMRALGVKNHTPDELVKLPEYKGQALIDEIYQAETPLKQLSAEERHKGRQEKVRPKVDAYFEYLKTLNPDDPSYSARLRDAIKYSLNQEDRLRMFLDDPNIPCDNGFAERSIKPFAILRKNCLFSFSVDGALSMAIIFSLVETARANKAHPYYYLMYLLEKMPAHMDDTDHDFLPSMMPWSEEYKKYEFMKKQEFIRGSSEQEPVQAPKTPRKKDRKNQAA